MISNVGTKLTPKLAPLASIAIPSISEMSSENILMDFLSDRRVIDKKNDFSMCGLDPNFKGKWNVTEEDYDEFLDLLHDYLFVHQARPLCLVEQVPKDGMRPLIIDLDFRYPSEKSLNHSFTGEHIRKFVDTLIEVVSETFDMPKLTRYFVTLRPQAYADKKNGANLPAIKDGVHIECPELVVNADMIKYIRFQMLERQAVASAFGNTGYNNSDDKVYDDSLEKNGWMFYGESKPSIPAYRLAHVYRNASGGGRNVITEEKVEKYDARQLMGILSIRHKLKPMIRVKDAMADSYNNVITSLRAPPSFVAGPAVNPLEVALANQEPNANAKSWMHWLKATSPSSDIELAKKLALECLSEDRADGYNTWMRVGWCLRNIDPSEEMFDVWMAFSNKSGKSGGNNNDALRRDWVRGALRYLENGSAPALKMGSLHKWAREDNEVAYRNIMKNNVHNEILKLAKTFRGGTHHHIAKMMYRLFGDCYRCSIENRTTEWYKFENNTWKMIPQGADLKKIISYDMGVLVDEAKAILRHQLYNSPDNLELDPEEAEKQREMKVKELEDIMKLEQNLYNAGYKDSVMKECILEFKDDNFSKMLNQDPYKVGVANGVIHLRNPELDNSGNVVGYKVKFCPGDPDDYVSFQAGNCNDDMKAIHYSPYDPNDPAQAEIMDFFEKIFPDPALRHYVLVLSAGCLEGANMEQSFYILTGSGGNGKSKYTDLMNYVMGDYAMSASTTLFTGKKPESGAANPEVIVLKNKRIITMQEPGKTDRLNAARIKQYTGNDYVEARGLFKEQERFKIMGKIFLSCNRLPVVTDMDNGFWRRPKVIPFVSRFVKEGDPTIDPSNNVYPMDPMMDDKLKRWRAPFLSLLVHYYETYYCPRGLTNDAIIPDVVKQFTNKYQESYDLFGKFILERVRVSSIKDSRPVGKRVSVKEFLKVFKMWCMEQSGSRTADTSDVEIKARIVEKFNLVNPNAHEKDWELNNMILLHDEDEVEEYDNSVVEA